MKTKIIPLRCRVLSVALVFAFTFRVVANPTGMTVVSGSATARANGSQLSIDTSRLAVLNWQSFNIAAGERTVFNQPSASSVVVNRINDVNPSQIFGSLQGNGVVVLMNSSGFYFGPNSFVSAAGLVVSTANCVPPQNAGGSWVFNGPPPLASIVNYGSIKVGQNGNVFLIADKVENHGNVEAPGGTIALAAGQTVTLSERPDGRGMSMDVVLPQGSVDNYGNLIADGGTISLHAKVVNQNGLIQANSVREQNGVIELVASDTVKLGADSKIFAQGDDTASGSAGGNVTIKSDDVFSDVAGSQIVTAGGANGGNGGNVEVSAPNIVSLNTAMNALAKTGWLGGEFLLDPVDIILGTSGDGTVPGDGTVGSGDNGNGAVSGTLTLDVNTAFANKNFSVIKLQATGDITMGDGTTDNSPVWDLSGSTGSGGGQLILQAKGNIVLNDGSAITDSGGWSVSLQAGYNFLNNTITPGSGSVLLNGSSFIQTSSGGINLSAGKDVVVNSGYVVTTGGGGIDVHALTGNIDTGSDAQGYFFKLNASSISTAYDLSHGLGGISTEAGGDVNLTAGGNVTSILPGKKGFFYDGNFVSALNSDYTTAGSGAYGKQAGNVSIVAGGDVTGNYLVANGVGSIFAGVQMDANGNPVKDGSGNYVLGTTGSAGTSQQNLALNLIKGGWNVTAAKDIYLQEVRNPNGIFNVSGAAAMKHFFDYAPGDFVNLSAGNAVQLGGTLSSLPRVDTLNVPVIYPGILSVSAGAGGVTLLGDSFFNQLILFPSAQGGLIINTIGGGSLVGKIPSSAGASQIFNLIVSDSGSSQYKNSTSFGLNDHANTPVHLNQETPVQLNVSGDMNLLALVSPEAAQINVVGNMNNCRFQGMNLLASDVSSITVGADAKLNMEQAGLLNPATDGGLVVGGDINNRGAFTQVDLSNVNGAAAPDLSVFARVVGGSLNAATLVNSFYYDPITKILTYQNIVGTTLASVLSSLSSLTIQSVDPKTGQLKWLDPYETIPATETVSVFNSATAAALLAVYNPLGGIPNSSLGYTIGGGGIFNITARNLDLGTTPGILSKGASFYRVGSSYPLANLFAQGADINLNLTGDLTLYSSSIATLNGGDISIHAGGVVRVGSSDFTVTTTGTRGIYTTSSGDVSVVAGGNVDVNGSRIVTYDGGNITVESLYGDINAGNGVSSPVSVSAFYVDPVTRQVYQTSPQVPFSGIAALTFAPRDETYPALDASLGNVLVETPNGNVIANTSGILQLALNNLNYPTALVTVLAGYELRDSQGNPVSAANMTDATAVQVSAGRDINASGSGVIASNARLDASGDINGLIFARNNIDIAAQQNINVTALGLGNVSVNSAGGAISGTIIGVGSVTATGGSIDASLVSANVSGATSGQSGLGTGNAANATANAASAADSDATATKTATNTDEDDTKKKGIALAQKVSRVTVILPPKKLSETTTPNPKL